MSIAAASNNKKFLGGAGVQKELQGFAAFVAYQECHYRGLSATKGTLETSIGQQFFGVEGDDDSIGLSEQLVKGIGVFGGLYTLEDQEPSAVVTDANAFKNQSCDSEVLMVKPELHCLGHHVKIGVGISNGITLPLILQRGLNTKERVATRTLLFRAQDYMKNCKKALSAAMSPESPYKDYTKSGNLPSGMVHDDYLKYIRLKMYDILVNSAVGDITCIDDDDNDAVPVTANGSSTKSGTDNSRIMPETWFFPGFLSLPLLDRLSQRNP